MNICNNKISRRTNLFLRRIFIVPKMRRRLKKQNISILCNNCIAGFILHDLGQRFNTPTINMFFRGLDFFAFIEQLPYFLSCTPIQIPNPKILPDAPDYPVAKLGDKERFKSLELHFLHYHSFSEAEEKWDVRKKRMNMEELYAIWSFVGMAPDEELYQRAQNLPIKNKVIFVNHPVDVEKYPDFYYIKGFEKENGLGQIASYMNLLGKRYYDQFDFVQWINTGIVN